MATSNLSPVQARTGNLNEKDQAGSALEEAFGALMRYDLGSDRGALLPLDAAVTAAIDNPSVRAQLEKRLMRVLLSEAPAVAKDYACGKLALIGSSKGVAALGTFLADAFLATSARNALQSIGGDSSGKIIRSKLPTLSGTLKIGAINSLGVLRDPKSVPSLAACLVDRDHDAVSAERCGCSGIGRSRGSVAAGKQLQRFNPTRARQGGFVPWVDACLKCAEHLLAAGKRKEALSLLGALEGQEMPGYVKAAVSRLQTSASKASR